MERHRYCLLCQPGGEVKVMHHVSSLNQNDIRLFNKLNPGLKETWLLKNVLPHSIFKTKLHVLCLVQTVITQEISNQ